MIMRTDKTKTTVKYNKIDSKVIGYFPNDKDYPNESFVENSDFGYIEITKEEWRNKPSQAIVNGNSLEEYVKPDSELLQEAKDAKIAQIKLNRDQAQLKPVTNPSITTAPLLLGLNQELAGEDVNFSFDTKPTGNGLTSPETILTDLIIEDSTTDYATERLDTNEDCYVRIDKTIAQSIRDHLKVRVIANIGHARDLVKQVNDCLTIEEVNNIDINFS